MTDDEVEAKAKQLLLERASKLYTMRNMTDADREETYRRACLPEGDPQRFEWGARVLALLSEHVRAGHTANL